MIDRELVMDMYDEGDSISDIADKFAVPESVIRDIIRDYLAEQGC